MPGHIAGAEDLRNNDPSCDAAKHVWAVLGSACAAGSWGAARWRWADSVNGSTLLAATRHTSPAAAPESFPLPGRKRTFFARRGCRGSAELSSTGARQIRLCGPAAAQRMKAFREAAEIYRIATLARCG
jgi:hypothetical protein